jgi:acetyltransferase-like isoleucine patch superfamily enzyme
MSIGMARTGSDREPRPGARWRIVCTVATIAIVEAAVFGLAVAPVLVLWSWLASVTPDDLLPRVAVFSVASAPSYVLFALGLMFFSALATRVTGARTPDAVELRIADMEWPALRWARYMVSTHVVRVFAGMVFRGSPIWTWYLRLNGARLGRRTYVNSLFISDHNLLEFGDDVVIGADVHLSGHTVERGILKTGPVKVGRGVVIGIDTVIDIDVEFGAGCQVAAMSFVPKHSRLDPGALYGGVPVRKISS